MFIFVICNVLVTIGRARWQHFGHGYNAEVRKCGSGYGYNALSLILFLTLIHDTDYHGETRVPNRRP
jgi:hypothetical protein